MQPPATARLSEIHARTLVIRGDHDHPSYMTLADRISAGIEAARTLVNPGGTHFLNLEQPKESERALPEFVRPKATSPG